MKLEYTYSEIYNAIKKRGYKIGSNYEFPKWTGTVHVSLTPALAKALVEHDNKIQSYKKFKNNNAINDKDSSDVKELSKTIELESSYEIRKGQRYLEHIASLDHDVEVEITVYNDEHDPKALFCDLIKDSVADFYSSNKKNIDTIDNSIWHEQFLQIVKRNIVKNGITKESFIELLKEDEDTEEYQEPILVAILAKNRIQSFPDKIAFIKSGDLNSPTEINFFSCNLIPSMQKDNDIGYFLMPGYYKNVMVATTANDGLIQANPINIYTVVLDNDKNICGYKKTDYTFMRITIPLQENVPNGIFPMGAAFESDIKKKEFIESIDFGLIQMYQTIPYIILEEADFEDFDV